MNPKQRAAAAAVNEVQNGMVVGLGTGSTAYWAIQMIGERVQRGLQIKAVASSQESERLARQLGIPIAPFSAIDRIDIDIDGADEIDPALNLIKGGGGALLREKIIAANCRRFIVVADESKLVSLLGRFPLPVEIVPFAWELSFRQLNALGAQPTLRKKAGQIFITDNGNYILDCAWGSIPEPASLQAQLERIPGVVAHGLFIQMAHQAIVGCNDGTIKILKR